jgi:hypothetical protein
MAFRIRRNGVERNRVGSEVGPVGPSAYGDGNSVAGSNMPETVMPHPVAARMIAIETNSSVRLRTRSRPSPGHPGTTGR